MKMMSPSLERLLQDHDRVYAKLFGDYSESINYHMVLHLRNQIKNWGATSVWKCFPCKGCIRDLSDTLTSVKFVGEQIFNQFFLQLCAPRSLVPLPPCSSNGHLAPALRPLLTSSSDCSTESLHAVRFGREA